MQKMKRVVKWICGALILLLALVGLCNLLAIIPAKLTQRKIWRAAMNTHRITIKQTRGWQNRGGTNNTVVVVTNREDMGEFFDSLWIQPSCIQLLCMSCACAGDLAVSVPQTNAEPFEFTIHHGHSIRLAGSGPGDAVLTPGSAHKLALWLSNHGFYNSKTNAQQNAADILGKGRAPCQDAER